MNRAWYEQRLTPPSGCVRAVIDTDAGNQIDDQFALVYALLAAERIGVEAIYAAPFVRRLHATPEQGMRASFNETERILNVMRPAAPPAVFHGATGWLPADANPQSTPATDDLIRRAMDRPDDQPLYVIAIGAITNIATALLIEPGLAERIVLVWLAGQSHEASGAAEYNLAGDLLASRTIFTSGVPLVQIPCEGVADSLRLDADTLRSHAAGCGPIGEELVRLFMGHDPNHPGASKVIWDLAPVAWVVEPGWVPSRVVATPTLTERMTWQANPSGCPMRLATGCRAEIIYQDLFTRMADSAPSP